MLLPIAIAVSSIACGALLALLPRARSRLLEPIRTFALTASLGVVVTHLLPEAFEAIHGWALVVFVLSLAIPSGLHALGERVSGPQRALRSAQPAFGIEVAYAGLLLHQVADGVSLGTYGGARLGGHSHPDVLLAIFAHTVPMVAILVLGVYDAYGFRAAFVRAGLLAVATSIGIVAVDLVSHDVMERAAPWISAAAAGLLLHVVAHASRRARRSAKERALDLVAALLGLAVALVGSVEPNGIGIR
jgi:hypothetical protein